MRLAIGRHGSLYRWGTGSDKRTGTDVTGAYLAHFAIHPSTSGAVRVREHTQVSLCAQPQPAACRYAKRGPTASRTAPARAIHDGGIGAGAFDPRDVFDRDEATAALGGAFRIIAEGVAPGGFQIAGERDHFLWGSSTPSTPGRAASTA